MLNISENERLELLFDFFYALKKHKIEVENSSKEYVNEEYFLMAYMIELFGFNKFPEVVSDDEYKKIRTKNLYRGGKDNEFNANLLADFDYHYGCGCDCNGIYSSTERAIANEYANRIESNIITFKFNGRLIDFATLSSYANFLIGNLDEVYKLENVEVRQKIITLKNFMHTIRTSPKYSNYSYYYEKYGFKHKIKDEFLLDISLNKSLLAIYLGYDAFISTAYSTVPGIVTNGKPINVIILNRASMKISQSEFNRICNSSQKYKGGVIDFDKKGSDEFLHESDFMKE